VFKNPSAAFLKVLAESGPVPGIDDRKRKVDADDSGQRKRTNVGWTGKPSDMERLAAGIEQLSETDLLPVVKLIWENQTPDMYVKSDVDGIRPVEKKVNCRGRVCLRYVYLGTRCVDAALGLHPKESGDIVHWTIYNI